MKDLDPIMTPNTVLTDCLNGTLITYNGNEFALQNDMGNYKFKYGALGNGFVPVGLKEHGGFLYIVSYNPIDNKVEIGTFPSQKTIFDSLYNNIDTTLKTIDLNNKINYYSQLMQGKEISIFSYDDIFYLNPGDKYILNVKQDGNSFGKTWNDLQKKLRYQHLTPFILTNEKELYNIDGYIKLSVETETINRELWTPVQWEIPGWLCAKFSINTPLEFNVFFDSNKSVVKEYKDLKNNSKATNAKKFEVYQSGTLNLQTIWDKTIYKDLLDNEESNENIIENLDFLFLKDKTIFKEYAILDDINDDNFKLYKKINNTNPISKIEYNKSQSILYCNINYDTDLIDYHYVVPVLNIDDKYIIYDQFLTEIKTNSQIIDVSKINIGGEDDDDLFKYYVDDNSLTLEFSFEGYRGVDIHYNLYRYTENNFLDKENKSPKSGTLQKVFTEDRVLTNLNYVGQNLIDIPFTTLSEYTEYKYNNNDLENKYYKYYISSGNDNVFNGKTDINTSYSFGENHFTGENAIRNTFDKEDVYLFKYKPVLNGIDLWDDYKTKIIWCTEFVNIRYNSLRNFNSGINAESIRNLAEDQIEIIGDTSLDAKETSFRYNSTFTKEKRASEGHYDTDGYEYIDEQVFKNIFENNNSPHQDRSTYLGEDVTIYNYHDRNVYGVYNVGYGYKYIYKNKYAEEENNNKFNLAVPVNQYGAIGRMWRNVEILKINKNGTLIDSNRNNYNLLIKDPSLIDNDGFYDFTKDTEISFILDKIANFTHSTTNTINSTPIIKPFTSESSSYPVCKAHYKNNKVEDGLEKLEWIGCAALAHSGGRSGNHAMYKKVNSNKSVYFNFDNEGMLTYWSSNFTKTIKPNFKTIYADKHLWKVVDGYFGNEDGDSRDGWTDVAVDDFGGKNDGLCPVSHAFINKFFMPVPIKIWSYHFLRHGDATGIWNMNSGGGNPDVAKLGAITTVTGLFRTPDNVCYVMAPSQDENGFINRSDAYDIQSITIYWWMAIMWYVRRVSDIKHTTIYFPRVSVRNSSPKDINVASLNLNFRISFLYETTINHSDSKEPLYEKIRPLMESKELDIYSLVKLKDPLKKLESTDYDWLLEDYLNYVNAEGEKEYSKTMNQPTYQLNSPYLIDGYDKIPCNLETLSKEISMSSSNYTVTPDTENSLYMIKVKATDDYNHAIGYVFNQGLYKGI